jgi:secreted trypsin-like serine protease
MFCDELKNRPLITKGSNAADPAQDVLQGVVNWGYGCAVGYPGVYAKVSYASEWIARTTFFVAIL